MDNETRIKETRISLLRVYERYMHLKVYVDSPNNSLHLMYTNSAFNHNMRLLHGNDCIDAGFDLVVPIGFVDGAGATVKVDHMIKCSATMVTDRDKCFNTGYYMYPRSSLSKTPLRLANSVGIIDAGYRGHLISVFDATKNVGVCEYDRLVQICAPGLVPIYVEIVDQEELLGETTVRGDGGFGSTGR
jgi:dUTP pyrophosphatase